MSSKSFLPLPWIIFISCYRTRTRSWRSWGARSSGTAWNWATVTSTSTACSPTNNQPTSTVQGEAFSSSTLVSQQVSARLEFCFLLIIHSLLTCLSTIPSTVSHKKTPFIPNINLKSCEHLSFSYVAPSMRNSLPTALRTTPTLRSSNLGLKPYFLLVAFP